MTISKTQLPSESSPKSIGTALNFGANTLTSAFVYKHGIVTVVEFVLSDSSAHFLKIANNGNVEVGGTLELGTGTKVSW